MNETLQRWRKVCEAATEGPWEFERIAHDSGEFAYERNDDHALMVLREANYEKPMKAKFDAEFIALSRTALPATLDCVEMALKMVREKELHYFSMMEGAGEPEFGQYEFACLAMKTLREDLEKQIHARLESVPK